MARFGELVYEREPGELLGARLPTRAPGREYGRSAAEPKDPYESIAGSTVSGRGRANHLTGQGSWAGRLLPTLKTRLGKPLKLQADRRIFVSGSRRQGLLFAGEWRPSPRTKGKTEERPAPAPFGPLATANEGLGLS